ncbi:MAG TPA: cytochrome P450 [Pseudonocardiaceae bacterium]|jgi:cytochrome P450|nr:cytochrome P450 [Pseudonocardiaceae bacterium]
MAVLQYPFRPIEGLVPHPRYAQLREEGAPVRIRMPYGGEAWLVTRYADVRVVLADHRFSRAAAAGRDVPRARPPMDSPDQIISMDPPDHTRLRTLVAKEFTARRVEALRPRVRELVDGLLDALPERGADLAAGLAWPLPVTVICELLGVPPDDHASFRGWTELTLALGADTRHAEIAAARAQLNTYLANLIAHRRGHPTGDLLSDLITARDHDDKLSEEELVRLAVTLLISGHETTANQLGNFVYLLLSDRRQWERLVADPALIPRAVEELLRYTPMAASVDFARVAVADVELPGGGRIRAGDAVLVQLHAANRDVTVFNHPDELDLARTYNPHLAFGHGVHHCLGAPLARMELQVTLAVLVRRLPGLRLAVPAAEIPWRADRLVRGVRALPVGW